MKFFKKLDSMQIALLMFTIIWIVISLVLTYSSNPETGDTTRGYQSITTYLLIGVMLRYVSHSFGNIIAGVNGYKITVAWVLALDLIAKFVFGSFGSSQIMWLGIILPVVSTILLMLLMEIDLRNYKVYDEEKGEEEIEFY